MRKAFGYTILGGLALFGAGLYYYFKKQKQLLENYDYRILRLNIDTINLQLIKGKIIVLFMSDADIEVEVSEFIVDFYFNGEKVGYITEENKFIIPARGSAEIPLEFTLNPQLVFGNASDIVSYSLRQKDASISVRGYATLKSGFVKATLPIVYDTTLQEIMA